jgi:hypothetical protein
MIPNPICSCVLLWVLALATTAHGQSDDAARPGDRLPPPLGDVSGGLQELEATGYFQLTRIEFGRTPVTDEEALIWTVRVVKPLTCRHAMILLHRVGDVRISRVIDKRLKELHISRLYYPAWIESGAAHGRVIDRHQEFEVWLCLDDKIIAALIRDQASRIDFRPLPL